MMHRSAAPLAALLLALLHSPRSACAQFPPRVLAVVPHAPTHLVEVEAGAGTLIDRYPNLTGVVGRLGYTSVGPEWAAQARLGATIFLTGEMVVGELLAGRSLWDGHGTVWWLTAGPALTSTHFCAAACDGGGQALRTMDVRHAVGLAGELGVSTPNFISLVASGMSVSGNLNRERSYASFTLFTGWGLRW